MVYVNAHGYVVWTSKDNFVGLLSPSLLCEFQGSNSSYHAGTAGALYLLSHLTGPDFANFKFHDFGSSISSFSR